jgi:hypothetical protein
MNAITVCVGYDDFLAKTMPRNWRYFDRWVIVTDYRDERTAEVAGRYADVAEVLRTDAFYYFGARFNKGLAIEIALDHLGRDGWILMLDADIVLPKLPEEHHGIPGHLYGARRRQVSKPSDWDGGYDWSRFPLLPEGELAGCFHLVHGSDPILQSRPWYGVNWKHAGGYDSDLFHKYPADKRRYVDFEVLHLGEHGVNWNGRATPRLDGSGVDKTSEAQMLMRQIHNQRATAGYRNEKIGG